MGRKDLKKEREMLDKIKKGDQDSFNEFYNLEFEKIYKFVSFKMPAGGDIEEVVQDVFFKFWKYLREGGKVKNAIPLLYRIARARIVDYYRKSGVRPITVSLEYEDGSEIHHEDLITDKDIEYELNVDFEIEVVRQAMEKLPGDYKEVLVMRFLQEMSSKEVAQVVEKSEGAVRVMVHRGVKLLKKIIENNKKDDANFR